MGVMSLQNKKGTELTTKLCRLPRFEQHPCNQESLYLKALRQHAHQDAEYEALKASIIQGFPNTKTDLPIP